MKRLIAGAVGAIASLFFAAPSFASEANSLTNYKNKSLEDAEYLANKIAPICYQEEVKKLMAYRLTNNACQRHFETYDLYKSIVTKTDNAKEILDMNNQYFDNIEDIYIFYRQDAEANFEAFKKSIGHEE